MSIDILDKNYEPTKEEITSYMNDVPKNIWVDLTTYIETKFKSKSQIFYSKCSSRPGWNMKYKKSGKTLCTLYPEKDYFTALVVLNGTDMKWFDGMKDNFSNYLINLYNNCGMFNGTKWLMIDINNEEVLNDVKKLVSLKLDI